MGRRNAPAHNRRGGMYYKMIPYAIGVLLMVAAAIRFASKDDFVGAGIALLAALVASFTGFQSARR